MNTESTLLANVRLAGGRNVDIRMTGGVIEAIGPDLDAEDAVAIDGGGLLTLPGMIDGHVHLDKTLTGLPWFPYPAGPSRASRIATERGLRAQFPPPAERASNLVRQAVTAGTTAFRSHADIGPDIGLRHVEALLEVKAAFAHAADFQIVAFPQYGVLAAPGTFDLMDEALAMGADVVGGIDPIVQDGDLDGQLDLLFRLAEKHGTGIDPHIHDPGEPGMREIAALAERARATGMEGRVTVSHGFCLGACPDDVFERLAGAMAEAGMSLVTNGAGVNPLPPVKKLRARGVEVFIGNDDVRDTWSPYPDFRNSRVILPNFGAIMNTSICFHCNLILYPLVVPTLPIDLAGESCMLWPHVFASEETNQGRQGAPVLEHRRELPQPRWACRATPSALSRRNQR